MLNSGGNDSSDVYMRGKQQHVAQRELPQEQMRLVAKRSRYYMLQVVGLYQLA